MKTQEQLEELLGRLRTLEAPKGDDAGQYWVAGQMQLLEWILEGR